MPELPVGIGCQAPETHGFQRRLLPFFEIGYVVKTAFPSQLPQGGLIQILQQLGFPVIPHLRAGAADIRYRQQIECCQPARGFHQFGKVINHRRVVDVLLLRHQRHGQVLRYQPADQLAVFLG